MSRDGDRQRGMTDHLVDMIRPREGCEFKEEEKKTMRRREKTIKSIIFVQIPIITTDFI